MRHWFRSYYLLLVWNLLLLGPDHACGEDQHEGQTSAGNRITNRLTPRCPRNQLLLSGKLMGLLWRAMVAYRPLTVNS